MNKDTVFRARQEAKRFIRACEALRKRAVSDQEAGAVMWPTVGVAESAAVRRASLDLTRALAALRRPS